MNANKKMNPQSAIRNPKWLVVVMAMLCAGGIASAQKPSPRPSHPDLQGHWTNGTLTPLTRPDDLKDKAVFTEQEAAEWEKGSLQRFLALVPPEDVAMGSDLNDI